MMNKSSFAVAHLAAQGNMALPSLGEYQETGGPVDIDIARLIETRLLIQASSGGGKSWAIRRILEQTASHVQQLILDPEGEFRSLAENGNYLMCGAGPNDVPLTHGGELAFTLMENRTSAVIDLSELDPEERDVFVAEFVAQLVRLPQHLWSHTLVVIDEAHILCPQHDKSEAKKAIIDLCARGRKRGLCPVLATQRISKLHKSAAAELQNRIMGLTILDTDIKRAADEMGITLDKASTILPELNVGEFYVYGPALCKTINKVKVGGVTSRHGFLSGEIKPPTVITNAMRDSVTEKFKFVMKDKQEHSDRFTISGDMLTVGRDRFKIEQNISFVVATNEFTGTKQLLQVQMLDPVEQEAAVERRLRNPKLHAVKTQERSKIRAGKRGRRLKPDVEAIVTECIHAHRTSGLRPSFVSVYEDIGLRCSQAGYPKPAMMTVRKRIDWLPGKATVQ